MNDSTYTLTRQPPSHSPSSPYAQSLTAKTAISALAPKLFSRSSVATPAVQAHLLHLPAAHTKGATACMGALVGPGASVVPVAHALAAVVVADGGLAPLDTDQLDAAPVSARAALAVRAEPVAVVMRRVPRLAGPAGREGGGDRGGRWHGRG